ncbi:beta strand repeat-containing protein, partial [Flavobacterium sp.]|uniref:beta strand repeat-containing protein n=1 Tax=Flavobacterium sp. TaxID=239 RepID=UPI0037C07648
DETDETFNVAITTTYTETININDTAIGTIIDNDPAPTITIGDASNNEGSPISFPITLSNPSSQDITITFNLTNGTAGNDDYTTTPVTITIPAGQTTGTVVIPTADDVVDEPAENFTVTIGITSGGPVGATTDTATGTIVDNDITPIVTITGATVTEGSPVTFTATLSIASSLPTTINVVTNSGTASNSDFTQINATPVTTITIPAGALSTTISVPTIDDAIIESQELFTLVGTITSTNVNIVGSTTTGTGTINDNEDTLVITVADASATEGNTITFPVTLSNPVAVPTTFTFNLTNGTAGNLDYTTTPVTITIPANTTSSSFTVQTTADTIDETDETFNVAITTTYTETININDTAIGTIIDNDPAPTITIGDVTIDEGNIANVPVTLSNPSSVDTEITIITTNGTATSPNDYIAISTTTITIPAGQTSILLQVTSVEDAIDELNENLNVEGTVTSGNTSNASDFGIVTITDDDNAPIFSIANASANEGTNVIFIATLSNPSYLPTTILVSTTLNTAGVYPASNSDFTTVITTITIPAGQLTATVSVATINDSTDEPDETFLLNGTVTSENTNNVNDSAVGTIIDIDGVPTFSIDDVTIIEGNVAIVTVSISNLSSVDTVINITTSNGSAIAPDDYTPLTTIVIIPAGQTTTTVSIPTANDLIDEPTEAFTVNGNVTSSNTSNSNDTGIVTITDNNPLPTFTISDVTVIEGDLATVTISLTNPSYLDTVIDILTTEVSATSAEDYIEVTTTITIPASQTTTTILITTVEDGINEPSEILNVNGTSTSGNTANNNDSGTVTITDDDPKPIFTVSDVTVEEGDIANVIVSLSGQSSVDTVIAIVTTNVTATSLEDYTSVTTTITIPTGQLTASISIQTASDNIDEQNETFSVDGTATSGNTSNTNDSGTVTIIDDPADTATFNVEDVTVVEGITALVNVTLSNPSSVDTVLNIVSSNGTA